MSEDRTRIAVNIYGNQYKIMASGDTTEAYIKRIATEVNDQMIQIAKHNPRLDAQRIAVLAAVHMVDQNIRLQSEMEPLHRAKVQNEKHSDHIHQLSKELENAQEDKQQALDKLRELAEAERHRLLTEHETEMALLRDEFDLAHKHQQEKAGKNGDRLKELENDNARLQAQLEEERGKAKRQIESAQSAVQARLEEARGQWQRELQTERDEALAELERLQEIAAVAATADRETQQELDRMIEDYRRLQELYDSRQAEFQREQEQWEAELLKARANEATSAELERLRDEHRKLQDEYAKLQSEYNEWVELVLTNDK